MKSKRTNKAEEKARREAMLAKNRGIAAKGTCPTCSAPLRLNLSITGWWQCSQYGAVGFRADATKPSCDFQIFTE